MPLTRSLAHTFRCPSPRKGETARSSMISFVRVSWASVWLESGSA
jgi:hypothetical protein